MGVGVVVVVGVNVVGGGVVEDGMGVYTSLTPTPITSFTPYCSGVTYPSSFTPSSLTPSSSSSLPSSSLPQSSLPPSSLPPSPLPPRFTLDISLTLTHLTPADTPLAPLGTLLGILGSFSLPGGVGGTGRGVEGGVGVKTLDAPIESDPTGVEVARGEGWKNGSK